MADAVRYDVRGAAVWLTIDREDRRNALADDVIDGLLQGLDRAVAATADGVRAVVVTGAGDRAFCAGADLAGNLAPGGGRADAHARRGRVAELVRRLADHPQPVVARVNGVALAGGFGLMLGCDLVVAADDVELGTPEVNVGLWPYMISAVVARNVPRKIAMELMLTGRRLTAAEAARWGIVNRAVPRSELDTAVDALVEDLASKSPLVLRLGKESFRTMQDLPFDQALAYLNGMLTLNLETEDVAEGVAAFFEKRRPEWKGR